jgi:hypothetical protein
VTLGDPGPTHADNVFIQPLARTKSEAETIVAEQRERRCP